MLSFLISPAFAFEKLHGLTSPFDDIVIDVLHAEHLFGLKYFETFISHSSIGWSQLILKFKSLFFGF